MSGWQVDPTGRHQERFHDGVQWSAAVRDHGVENDDPAGVASLGSAAPAYGPPGMAVPVASFSAAGGSPPPLVGPPMSSAPLPPGGWSAPRAAKPRRGLPAFLAIALVLAAFPAILFLGTGVGAVMAGNDITSASSSSSFDSGSEFDFSALGTQTTERGMLIALIGAALLTSVIFTAMGSNSARVITTIWLGIAAIYALSQLSDLPTGAGKYVLLFLTPPIAAIIGMFTPQSNELFRAP